MDGRRDLAGEMVKVEGRGMYTGIQQIHTCLGRNPYGICMTDVHMYVCRT